MEEFGKNSSIQKTPTPGSKIIIHFSYILNDIKKDNEKMELLCKNHNSHNNNIKLISYDEIANSFYIFLEKKQNYNYNDFEENENEKFTNNELNNIIYDYIRYYDGEGWIFLEDDEYIFINDELTLDKLEVMIKVTIRRSERLYIKNQINNFNKEINRINKKFEINNDNNPISEMNFNLIVLTANPLMDGENELRTMNDFNNITSAIYKLLSEQDYLTYADFQPLTLNSFKEVILNEKKRPDILHLICKSTYIIPHKTTNKQTKNNDSSNFVNLIFEKENNYNVEYVNKKMISEIFSDQKMKKSIENMTLIISTQLAEDVYNIFQSENFKFKNILVQHTTLADTDFIEEFNTHFYKELIFYPYKDINKIYENALNIYFDKNNNTFCCCFHKHKNNCDFMKNLIHELYNDNNYKNNIEELKKIIPHFAHLMPKCSSINIPTCIEAYKDFCIHYNNCLNELKLKYKLSNKRQTNICCCKDPKTKHDVNNIFWKKFSDGKNNNKNKKVKIYLKNKYIPNYDKIELLVGRNRDVFKVMEFINSKNGIFNIYGDNMENLKILGNIIVEYYKERHYLYESKGQDIKCINLDENNVSDYCEDDLKNNMVYFIYSYVHEKTLIEITRINNKIKIREKLIILYFSEEKIDNQKINKFLEIIPEPIIKTKKEYVELNKKFLPNEYIKYQSNYIVRNIWKIELDEEEEEY